MVRQAERQHLEPARLAEQRQCRQRIAFADRQRIRERLRLLRAAGDPLVERQRVAGQHRLQVPVDGFVVVSLDDVVHEAAGDGERRDDDGDAGRHDPGAN